MEIDERKTAFLAIFLAVLSLFLLILFMSSSKPASASIAAAQQMPENTPVSITGRVEGMSIKGMEYVSLRVCDDTGCITANFHRDTYNPFLLSLGQYVTVTGNVRTYMSAKTLSASQVIA